MYAVSLTAYIHWVTVGLLVSPLIAYAYEVEHGRKKAESGMHCGSEAWRCAKQRRNTLTC